MRRMSLIMLFVAILLAGLTVFGVKTVIDTNRTAQFATEARVQEPNMGSVVVALVPLKFGDELKAEQLNVVDWPADIRPEGSFESIGEMLGDERRVALRSISRNEPIVRDKISGFGARASLSQVIEEGRRAVTIRVNDVISVGGFVLPGDKVDILHSYQPGEDILDTITNIILEDVRVLAIDQILDEAQEGAVVGKAATIEVTPEQAQKIALAAKVGSLSLALRRMSNDETDDTILSKTIRVRDLVPVGDKPVVKAKYTGKRRYVAPVKAKAPAPSPFGEMKVTRGEKQTDEQVPVEGADTLPGGLTSARPNTVTLNSTSNTDMSADLKGFTGSVAAGVNKTTKTITAIVPQ